MALSSRTSEIYRLPAPPLDVCRRSWPSSSLKDNRCRLRVKRSTAGSLCRTGAWVSCRFRRNRCGSLTSPRVERTSGAKISFATAREGFFKKYRCALLFTTQTNAATECVRRRRANFPLQASCWYFCWHKVDQHLAKILKFIKKAPRMWLLPSSPMKSAAYPTEFRLVAFSATRTAATNDNE